MAGMPGKAKKASLLIEIPSVPLVTVPHTRPSQPTAGALPSGHCAHIRGVWAAAIKKRRLGPGTRAKGATPSHSPFGGAGSWPQMLIGSLWLPATTAALFAFVFPIHIGFDCKNSSEPDPGVGAKALAIRPRAARCDSGGGGEFESRKTRTRTRRICLTAIYVWHAWFLRASRLDRSGAMLKSLKHRDAI